MQLQYRDDALVPSDIDPEDISDDFAAAVEESEATDQAIAIAEIPAGAVRADTDPLRMVVETSTTYINADSLTYSVHFKNAADEYWTVPITRAQLEAIAVPMPDRPTLLDAAQSVLDNWERGDLAVAVRRLAVAVAAAQPVAA